MCVKSDFYRDHLILWTLGHGTEKYWNILAQTNILFINISVIKESFLLDLR